MPAKTPDYMALSESIGRFLATICKFSLSAREFPPCTFTGRRATE